MNIALVVHRFRASEGTGGYVVRLARALADQHEVTVYAAEADAPLPTGVRLVQIPAIRRPASATILTFPRRFGRRRGQHDLVHAQGWVTREADVVTAHIVLAAWRHAAAAAGVRPPPGERMIGWWVARQEAELFRTARAVIAPSRRVAEEIRMVSGRVAPVHVVPHGFPEASVNLPDRAAARTALGLQADRPLALFVGDARKGLARALAALARVPHVQLAVASHSRRHEWERIARDLGIADRMQWLGPRDDTNTLYDAADVLLHPTPYDTFGLVIAEAMARGCPAITTNMAGITELYDDSAGWMVAGDNPDETATVLREAVQDGPPRNRRALAGLAVAARRPWSVVVQETVTVYEGLS